MNAYPAPKPALVAALAALLAEHGPNALNELVATQLLLDSRESAEGDEQPWTDASWDEFGPEFVTDWTASLTEQLLQELCGQTDFEYTR